MKRYYYRSDGEELLDTCYFNGGRVGSAYCAAVCIHMDRMNTEKESIVCKYINSSTRNEPLRFSIDHSTDSEKQAVSKHRRIGQIVTKPRK